MWLTSTDDHPALKMVHDRAIRLQQRATEVGNQVVAHQQETIITNLALRLKSLQPSDVENTLNLDEMLAQLRTDLTEAESGLEEAQTAGLLVAAKQLERTVRELRLRLTAMEGGK